MKKIIAIACISMLISGCATTEYYTSPQNAGYSQQVWNCVCEKCNRVFTISCAQYDSGAPVSCCYCGQTQDTKLARNRGIYAEQQAQQQQILAQRQQAQVYHDAQVQADAQARANMFQANMTRITENSQNILKRNKTQTTRGTITPNYFGGYDYEEKTTDGGL